MSHDMSTRCNRCFMYLPLCICSLIPQINLPTKIIIVVSKREVRAATNTGRLANLALVNSSMLTRGDLASPYNLAEHLMPGAPSYLLYPSAEATEISPQFISSLRVPINLVVPDGNWRQAVKMCRRDPVMAKLPQIKIPPGGVSNYLVRTERKAGGLATLEAIARALGLLENVKAQAELENLMNHMVERTMSRRRNR